MRKGERGWVSKLEMAKELGKNVVVWHALALACSPLEPAWRGWWCLVLVAPVAVR